MSTLTLGGDAAHPLYLYVVFFLCVAGVVVLLAGAALTRSRPSVGRRRKSAPPQAYEAPVVRDREPAREPASAPVPEPEPEPASAAAPTPAPRKRATKKTAAAKAPAYPDDELEKLRKPAAPRKRATAAKKTTAAK